MKTGMLTSEFLMAVLTMGMVLTCILTGHEAAIPYLTGIGGLYVGVRGGVVKGIATAVNGKGGP